MMSRMMIRLQRSPSSSSVRLMGQPERCGSMETTSLTACKIGADALYGNCLRKRSSYGWRRNNGAAEDRSPRRMAGGTQGASDQGEGAHEGGRRPECGAACTSMGQGREGVSLRCS